GGVPHLGCGGCNFLRYNRKPLTTRPGEVISQHWHARCGEPGCRPVATRIRSKAPTLQEGKLMQRTISKATTSILLIVAANQAPAALFDVDPGPYTPENGSFAAWYQDTHGRTLDLCLSKAQSSRAPGSYMCTLSPEPGVFDDTQPV